MGLYWFVLSDMDWWAGLDSNQRCILRDGFTVRGNRHYAYRPILIAIVALKGALSYQEDLIVVFMPRVKPLTRGGQ